MPLVLSLLLRARRIVPLRLRARRMKVLLVLSVPVLAANRETDEAANPAFGVVATRAPARPRHGAVATQANELLAGTKQNRHRDQMPAVLRLVRRSLRFSPRKCSSDGTSIGMEEAVFLRVFLFSCPWSLFFFEPEETCFW